jgi:hypothetical protein
MLSPLDDYPVHQVAEVMRHVGTGDRHFYDRYYFNLYNRAADLFCVFGLGQYPNLGTTDVFTVVTHRDIHRVVRASRELGEDRMNTAIGPMRVEVVEPLRKLRVVCEPSEAAEEAGVEIDATFEGSIPAYLEPRHFYREFERAVFDTQRLAQTGRWSGQMRVGGETIDLDAGEWWGYRDRSWGVRPVGDPEPPGIRASQPRGGFFWLYAPLQFADHSYLIIAQERQDGTRLLEEAVRVWNDGRVDHLGRPSHDVEFVPGTRAPNSATLHVHEPDGTPLDIFIEPRLPCYLMMGSGYGPDPDWRHGMWQGPLKVQGLTWDLTSTEVRKGLVGMAEYSSRVATSTGETGYGMFEFSCVGPHDQYGFTGWEDMGLVVI